MYLKSYFTFLSRNKGYTAINVLGLSLSMMFVILIGVYTWQEYHVNSQYPKADRILVYGLDMHRRYQEFDEWWSLAASTAFQVALPRDREFVRYLWWQRQHGNGVCQGQQPYIVSHLVR